MALVLDYRESPYPVDYSYFNRSVAEGCRLRSAQCCASAPASRGGIFACRGLSTSRFVYRDEASETTLQHCRLPQVKYHERLYGVLNQRPPLLLRLQDEGPPLSIIMRTMRKDLK